MAAAADAPAPFDPAAHRCRRHRAGGTSGAVAHGRLAARKAHIANAVTASPGVRSVVGFGSGNGNPASLFRVPRLASTHERARDSCKRDGASSVDVTRLVKDAAFEASRRQLLQAAARFAPIRSGDHASATPGAPARQGRPGRDDMDGRRRARDVVDLENDITLCPSPGRLVPRAARDGDGAGRSEIAPAERAHQGRPTWFN